MDFQPMSPEEMQRAMQFIVSQQTQFAADLGRHHEQVDADLARHREQFDADMEKLSASVEKLSVKTDLIADGLVGLTAIVGQVAAAQLRSDEQLRELREADIRLTKRIERVDSFEQPARRSSRRRKH